MSRRYQKIVRSTTAFLEMKESDIMGLNEDTLASIRLPKHILSNYRKDSKANSGNLYPHICDLKVIRHRDISVNEIESPYFVNLSRVC